MTTVRVRGVQRFKRKGRWYCYHRKSGTALREPFGTPAFFKELAEAEAKWQGRGSAKAKPGTLGQVITSYRTSPAFADLAERTRADYQKVFDYLSPMDGMELAKIDAAWIAKLRDKTYRKRKRRFANYVLSVLSSTFKHAKEYGLMADNPALGMSRIRRPKSMPKANRPWTESERREVLSTAPRQLRLPLALSIYTALRQGDVLTVSRDVIKPDGWIVVLTGKAGTEVPWPIHPHLQEIIDEAEIPEVGTLCLNSRGKPWTASGFRASLRTHLLGLYGKGSGLTFHGLRHTKAAMMKEAGASDEDIAIALGQKTVAMARHYSESASKRKRMGEVVKLLERDQRTDSNGNGS